MTLEVGWFGKLPSAGDFVGRRLPAEFQRSWDDWLQLGLTHSRSTHDDGWLDLYLTFPVWRFMLPPGAYGEDGWCGVLLPSVDRVGRCFPLTICERLPVGAARPGLLAIDGHLEAFASAGIDALDGMAVDELDARLSALPAISESEAPSPLPLDACAEPAAGAKWALSEPLADALARAAGHAIVSRMNGRALWWLAPSDEFAGELRVASTPLAATLFDELISVQMQAGQ